MNLNCCLFSLEADLGLLFVIVVPRGEIDDLLGVGTDAHQAETNDHLQVGTDHPRRIVCLVKLMML